MYSFIEPTLISGQQCCARIKTTLFSGHDFGLVSDEYPVDAAGMDGDDGKDEEGALLLHHQLKKVS